MYYTDGLKKYISNFVCMRCFWNNRNHVHMLKMEKYHAQTLNLSELNRS